MDIYTQLFRTNDVVCDEHKDELHHELIEALCKEIAEGKGLFLSENAPDWQFEAYWDEVMGFKAEAEAMMNNGVEFIYLVNYKGEGMGFATKKAAENLPLYISKYNYK